MFSLCYTSGKPLYLRCPIFVELLVCPHFSTQILHKTQVYIANDNTKNWLLTFLDVPRSRLKARWFGYHGMWVFLYKLPPGPFNLTHILSSYPHIMCLLQVCSFFFAEVASLRLQNLPTMDRRPQDLYTTLTKKLPVMYRIMLWDSLLGPGLAFDLTEFVLCTTHRTNAHNHVLS